MLAGFSSLLANGQKYPSAAHHIRLSTWGFNMANGFSQRRGGMEEGRKTEGEGGKEREREGERE